MSWLQREALNRSPRFRSEWTCRLLGRELQERRIGKSILAM
jgi:hypothetical protein